MNMDCGKYCSRNCRGDHGRNSSRRDAHPDRLSESDRRKKYSERPRDLGRSRSNRRHSRDSVSISVRDSERNRNNKDRFTDSNRLRLDVYRDKTREYGRSSSLDRIRSGTLRYNGISSDFDRDLFGDCDCDKYSGLGSSRLSDSDRSRISDLDRDRYRDLVDRDRLSDIDSRVYDYGRNIPLDLQSDSVSDFDQGSSRELYIDRDRFEDNVRDGSGYSSSRSEGDPWRLDYNRSDLFRLFDLNQDKFSDYDFDRSRDLAMLVDFHHDGQIDESGCRYRDMIGLDGFSSFDHFLDDRNSNNDFDSDLDSDYGCHGYDDSNYGPCRNKRKRFCRREYAEDGNRVYKRTTIKETKYTEYYMSDHRYDYR